MSHEGLHLPHDHGHEEHEGHGGASGHPRHHSLGQWVAIFSALVATLGAIIGYLGNLAMDEALMSKNEAVLKKAEASDQWSYYQSSSIKGHIWEVVRELAPPEKAKEMTKNVDKYNKRKEEIKAEAETFDKQSQKADHEAELMQRPHERLGMAMIFLQIAISVASVTALTGQRWLLGVAMAGALAGIGMAGWALL
jgi:hypothetical protein